MPTDIFKAARSPKTGVFGQALTTRRQALRAEAVQRRAQRIGREELLPESRRELPDTLGRMLADAL